ncbi:LOB domain-containing protein 24-like [Andrographis paniculata]|uniref:LOB domain-containing protein 24-like n=1 Tax=Andrographis paniculata TaxID=175694 RepID=UPI0021E933FE|nr:LOB domain-containing protein 24-like [Andrographis paniculata]
MSSHRCAACKHLRRRCPSDCIFSPYFPSNNPRKFSYVHKVYGASNVSKILQDLPVNLRAEAVESLYYEAYCRVKDPVYGCVGMITILHQQICIAQYHLARIQAEIAVLKNQPPIANSNNTTSAAGPSQTQNPNLFVGQNPHSIFDPSSWFA